MFAFNCISLYYLINVSLDVAMIAQSVTLLMGMLASMSTLTIGFVAPVLLAVVSIEFLVFDIHLINHSLYYEYEFQE